MKTEIDGHDYGSFTGAHDPENCEGCHNGVSITDRLKQIEERSGCIDDVRWLLAQLRGAEKDIDKAISLMCEPCADGLPVQREEVRKGIIFWRHREDGKIIADCDADAAEIHERRYQRERGK